MAFNLVWPHQLFCALPGNVALLLGLDHLIQVLLTLTAQVLLTLTTQVLLTLTTPASQLVSKTCPLHQGAELHVPGSPGVELYDPAA